MSDPPAPVTSPVLVSAGDPQNSVRWEQVFAAGSVSGGIQSDGSLWLWGAGPQSIGAQPQRVTGDFVWESASTDGQSVALVSRSGELYILDLSTLSSEPLFRPAGGSALWRGCAASGSYVLAIKRDGTLWRISLNGGEDSIQIGSYFRWKSLDVGRGYFVALREDGTLWWAATAWAWEPWAWSVGLAENERPAGSPYELVPLGDSNAWVHVAAGSKPLAVDKLGRVFWVSRNAMRLAEGSKGVARRVFVPKSNPWSDSSGDSLSGFSLGQDNTLWAWGNNSSGQLGNYESLPEYMGFTEDSAQVGVSPKWNLPSPVLGIPVGCTIPAESFNAGMYTVHLGGQLMGRVMVQGWARPENPASFVHYLASGSLSLSESVANPSSLPGTTYRWMRNGTLFAGSASFPSVSTATSGLYWAEAFTRMGTLQATGAASANSVTVGTNSALPEIGMIVEGAGIPPGTVVTGFVGSGTVLLSSTLSAAISNGSLQFGLTSRGESRVVSVAPKSLRDAYASLTAASDALLWDYSLISSGTLSNLLTVGSLKSTASLLKAAVDLVSLVSDSSMQVRLITRAGVSSGTFSQGFGPSPTNASLTAASLKVGDEITPTQVGAGGNLNFPRGTRITAITGGSIVLSNPALVSGTSTVLVSSSPIRRVLRSLGIYGGLDPRRGSAAADLENLILPAAMETGPVKKWLLNTNAALADKNPLDQLQKADTLLASITDPTFCAVIPLSVLAGSSAGSETFVVDYGDVLLMRCWVRLGMAALRWLDLQNTDMDLVALQKMTLDGSLSLQSIWEKYTSLGGAGSGKQADFEADFKAALVQYQAFSQFTNPRSGQQGAGRMIPGSLCLFPVEPEDERQMRDMVDKALDSLNAASATAGIRTFQLDDQEFITLSPNAFLKRTPNRADFPSFVGNRYVPGSLKNDLALAVYPDLTMAQFGGIERWLMALESKLDRQWKTGTASTLTIANTSVQGSGWVSVSGTLTGSAPVGGVKVNAESASGGTFSTAAIFIERPRASSTDPRIYDWSVQLPSPVVGGSVKITASAVNAGNPRASRLVERQLPVVAGSLPTIVSPGSFAFAVVASDTPETARPADLAVLFAGSGVLSYQWTKGGSLRAGDQGVAGAVDDWAKVSVGNTHTAAIKRDGTLWTWGSKKNGQLGVSSSTDSFSVQNFPAQVGTESNWVDVACNNSEMVALKRDGTLWKTDSAPGAGWSNAVSWRMANLKSLTFDFPDEGSTPIQAKRACAGFSLYGSDNLPGGGHLLAVTRDGALWQWSGGETLSPMGTDKDWVSASAGVVNFAIKSDGSLWGWTDQSHTEKLIGWNQERNPMQIGSETDWIAVKTNNASSGFNAYAVALKKDGSLWAWGVLPWNPYSWQSYTPPIPQRLGPPSMTWKEFFPGPTGLLAVTTNGGVFEFDWDPARPRPVALPSPAVAGSRRDSTSAILTQDGILWMWGDNTRGQIGNYLSSPNNDVLDPLTSWGLTDPYYVSTPVQVGVNPAWKLFGTVRGIPVPLHRDAVSREDMGSYQVQVSRGSDLFGWRVFSGKGTTGAMDGSPQEATFYSPVSMTLLGGSLYVADRFNRTIRQVRLSTGSVSTLAFANNSDVGPELITSNAGSLFILEKKFLWNPNNERIFGSGVVRAVIPKTAGASIVTTIIDDKALDGTTPSKVPFLMEEGPSGIAVDKNGTIYVADTGNGVIRRVTTGGSAALIVAGSLGRSGFQDGLGVDARFSKPNGLALFGGTLFVADTGNNAIRRILLSSGSVTTVAGIQPGSTLEENLAESRDGLGRNARFHEPNKLAVDESGTLYVMEPSSLKIRRITPDGNVTTVGDMQSTYFFEQEDDRYRSVLGNGGDIFVNSGTLYVSDTMHNRIVAGMPPAAGAVRGSTQVTLVNFDLEQIAQTPSILSGSGSLNLLAGANTPQSGVTYQWNRNGTAIAGATALNLSLPSPTSGWYTLVARAGSGSFSAPPVPVCVDNANVARARAAMAQGNFALASGTLSATSKDGTELILRSLLDIYAFLNEASTRTALGTLGVTVSGTLANGWVDPWSMKLNGRLKNLAGPAPTAALKAIFTASTANSLHAKLEAADAKLAGITDKSFVTVLLPSDLGKVMIDADPMVVDYGDVQMGRAILQAAMAAIKWLEMQNTDVDLFSLLFSSQNGRLSLESLLARNPSLFAASTTGVAAQTAFETRIKDALKSYQAFSDFVNPSSGVPARVVQNLGLFTFESARDRADERVFRDSVNKALDSINAATVAAGVRTFDLGEGEMSPPVSPRAFVKHAPGWRTDLPRFQKNRYVPNSLNLAAMRSLYPNLSYDELAKVESSKLLSESFWNQLLGTREDDAAPVLSLSEASVAGLKSSDGFVEIRGTASDASGVDNVRITLGSTGEIYDAILEEVAPSETGLRQYNWSAMLQLPSTLSGGSLRFSVAARDVLGGRMESPLDRSSLVLRMVPVSRSFLGNGSITLNPSPDADGLVAAGTSMLVTATPASGSLLRRIELTVDGEAQPNQTVKTTIGGTLRFTVTAPTDLTAVFELNPYPLLGGRNKMVGGLLEPDGYYGSDPLMSVQCTVTNSGEFSGKLFVGRQVSSFKGSFDEDGKGVFTSTAAQAWLPYSRRLQVGDRKLMPAMAVLSLWVDTSDETSPALYARVGGQSARLTPLAALDYTGPLAFTGVFGRVQDPEAWIQSIAGLGDGSARSGGFVSILPRRSGGFSLAGVLPTGEKITASGLLSDQFRGEAPFADQPAQVGDYSKIEVLTPTGVTGSTALSVTLSVPADGSRKRAALGWGRRENWLSLTRGPKYAAGPNVTPKSFASEWTVGAVEFTPAPSGRVVAPFAKSGSPTTSNVLGVGLKSPSSEEMPGSPVFSLAADTRNRLIISGRPAAGVASAAVFLNSFTGGFTGSFREAGRLVSIQGVLIQGELPAGTNLPYTTGGAGFTSDGRAVLLSASVGEFVTVSVGTLPADSPLGAMPVSTFVIGKTEVTWAQWRSVRTWAVNNGYDDLARVGQGVGDSYPVTDVSWYDVVKWCNARSQMEGKTPVYMVNGAVYKTGQSSPDVNVSANGYRLPTEAEWEFAARGGTQTNGYTYSGSNTLDAVGWYSGNAGGSPHIVGTKQANELGIWDMSGNVWEWCFSLEELSGARRMLRGGAWDYGEAASIPLDTRGHENPSIRYYHIGFRVALSSVP